MKIIAAVDNCWGIGKAGKLLVNIPEDMQMFRNETMGKVVVMGRKTFESLPGGRPLENRVNIVLTSQAAYKPKDVKVCHSFDEAVQVLAQYASDDIYIIGGGNVYEQFLPYCESAYITQIQYKYDADTFFPNLDELEQWEKTQESDERTYYDLEYFFTKYSNRGVKTLKAE